MPYPIVGSKVQGAVDSSAAESIVQHFRVLLISQLVCIGAEPQDASFLTNSCRIFISLYFDLKSFSLDRLCGNELLYSSVPNCFKQKSTSLPIQTMTSNKTGNGSIDLGKNHCHSYVEKISVCLGSKSQGTVGFSNKSVEFISFASLIFF